MIADTTFDNLYGMIKRGDLLGVRAWLVQGGDPNLLNRFGWTPLMAASMLGRTDIVELLLASGADPRLQNQFGDTATSLAALKGFHSTKDILEKAVAEDSRP